jgi:hypothetical protein
MPVPPDMSSCGPTPPTHFLQKEAQIMGIFSYFIQGEIAPVLLYFDHVDSEFITFKSLVTDPQDLATIDRLYEKRKAAREKNQAGDEETKADELSWNDLYTFELILAKYLPVEKLRSKVMQLRNDYRSIVGDQEFDQYMAAKPPDLMSPPDPTDPPDANQKKYERLLREDLMDLLGRLFLRYEILPVREAKLKALTRWAAGLCSGALLLLLFIVILLFLDDIRTAGRLKLPSLTIFVVVISGAMGGFVSALMRIQSPQGGGNFLYNLSQLFYGSYSIFVAPITGAIFAIILYLMFTSQVLQGSLFPYIYTPPANLAESTLPPDAGRSSPNTSNTANTANTASTTNTTNTANTANASNRANTTNTANTANRARTTNTTNTANTANTANTSNTANATGNLSSANANQPQRVTINSNAAVTATPTPTPSATPIPVATKGLNVKEFLAQSGPAGGKDYALLIIWCFIAGFAERFVPDALDRLIAQKGGGGGKSS